MRSILVVECPVIQVAAKIVQGIANCWTGFFTATWDWTGLTKLPHSGWDRSKLTGEPVWVIFVARECQLVA